MGHAADTIAAIATAPGRGAVGIVRVSGPAVPSIASQLIADLPAPRTAAFRPFRNQRGALIDQGLALYFRAPASYTGEDMLELQAHGGPSVLRQLLEATYAAGARAAEPGEFTQRAFLNGKIDLLQAESIATLIETSSTQAANAAARACAGEFSLAVSDINQTLVELRVLLEAGIDFADETEFDRVRITTRFDHLLTRLTALIRDAVAGARLNHGLDIAIIGKPNSGKSTLLNRLCREDRAIVTPLPGTTRDVLSVDIDLGGLSVRLHDTAGLRDAADPIEQEGLRRARALLKRCDALLYVTAIDQPADAEPPEVVAARQAGTAVLTVINKQDLQPAGSAPHSPAAGLVPVSALTGEGIAALEAALLDIAGGQEITDAPFIARARHVDALTRARHEAAQAAGEYRADAYELACEALRQASRALEEMTGVYTSEDLLGDIFSRFCIGK